MTIVENEYQHVEAPVKTKLAEASVLALQTDAWGIQRNESEVNVVVRTTPEPYFLHDPGT